MLAVFYAFDFVPTEFPPFFTCDARPASAKGFLITGALIVIYLE